MPQSTPPLRPHWLLFLLFLASCKTEPAPPVASPTESATPTPASAAPQVICVDRASVEAHLGRSCGVVGSYKIRTFPSKGGGSLGDWPVIVLGDGSEVMVESIWDKSKKPDATTVQRFQGKRVEVVGKLHTSPPKKLPENFGFFCISPVESIRLVQE